ncbi:MAG: HPr(Ser) kinase/phosphatase [Verrucomicrobiae bacterium]|jgi:HPr kinase/phosphorylase|nr:HPr(Ser) kinase/phosphatase [Verrucomicrobiae bacterium]PAW84817.1 MAG: HPr(Ser) kinase/phosphatase [Opitutae bacterium Tous-C2FEB]
MSDLAPETRPESVSVREFFDSFRDMLQMELLAGADGLDNVISEKSINRPALAVTGYFKEFANRRLQLFGAGEMAYLADQPDSVREKLLDDVFSKKVPAVVVSRGLQVDALLKRLADKHHVPIIRTQLKSKDFSAEATVLLEEKFAPRTNLHATLVDIRGVGVLLRGASGVGKSECALALIERGHSLVADDFVIVTLIGDRELQGTSKELNRGYMECRGIGIINIASIFGVRSVRREKRVDLVVTFVLWQPGMDEERSGLEVENFEILGRKVPHMTIPVRPGRDMARLVEVAAMVQALRGMGHDSAKEFSDRLIQHMSRGDQNKA